MNTIFFAIILKQFIKWPRKIKNKQIKKKLGVKKQYKLKKKTEGEKIQSKKDTKTQTLTHLHTTRVVHC